MVKIWSIFVAFLENTNFIAEKNEQITAWYLVYQKQYENVPRSIL